MQLEYAPQPVGESYAESGRVCKIALRDWNHPRVGHGCVIPWALGDWTTDYVSRLASVLEKQVFVQPVICVFPLFSLVSKVKTGRCETVKAWGAVSFCFLEQPKLLL